MFSSEVAREFVKAFVSFMPNSWENRLNLPPVATSHWGCGQNGGGGDLELKAIIQLLAATEVIIIRGNTHIIRH